MLPGIKKHLPHAVQNTLQTGAITNIPGNGQRLLKIILCLGSVPQLSVSLAQVMQRFCFLKPVGQPLKDLQLFFMEAHGPLRLSFLAVDQSQIALRPSFFTTIPQFAGNSQVLFVKLNGSFDVAQRRIRQP